MSFWTESFASVLAMYHWVVLSSSIRVIKYTADHSNIQFSVAFDKFTLAAGISVMLAGLSVLGGWALDFAPVKSILPGLATMKPITAAGLLMAGAGLLLLRLQPGNVLLCRLACICALMSGLIGALVLLEYASGIDFGIDRWLFQDWVMAERGIYPGRPAPSTALCLLLIGLALLTLDCKTTWLSSFFTLPALIISMVAIVGYAYGVSALYQIGPYSSIALHTALALLILSTGLLSAHPWIAVITTRLAGGVMARRILPSVIIILLGLGWLQLSGQRSGLYGAEFGLALFTTVDVILFAGLIYWTAYLLNNADARREAGFAAIRMSEIRFRQLADAAPNGLIITDREGRIRLANKQADTMFGYEPGRLLGQYIEILVPFRFQKHHSTYREAFVGAPQTRPMGAGRDLSGLRLDGVEFPLEIGLSPLETYEGSMTLVSIIDISERKRVMTALQESEERFRLMVECVRDYAIFMLDAEGHIVSWNVGAERIYGYRADEIIGRYFSCFYAEERVISISALQGELEQAITNGSYEKENWRVRKDGSRFWADVVITALRDKSGSLRGFAKVTRDITERKRTDEEIRSLNASLEQRILERTAELRESEARLTVSLKEKEALLKEIHHRVKNNLQVIASLLRLQSDTLADPSVRDLFLESQRRVRSMALIHEQLYQTSDFANINFADYAGSLVNYIRRSFGSRNANVEIRIDIADVCMAIDRAMPFGLIINELVSNSFKHAFPCEELASEGELWVTMNKEPVGSLTLEVGDSGQGLPDAVDIEQPSTMGLQLVQSFVLQLQGRLTVQRRPGTIFTIVIPERKNFNA